MSALPAPQPAAERPRQAWTTRRGHYRARRPRRCHRGYAAPLLALLAMALFCASLAPFQRWLYPLRFADELRAQALNFGLPPSLVAAVVLHESDFRSGALSDAGARGLMQLMPTTASWVAQREGFRIVGLDDLHDPNVSLYLGCAYLGHLYRVFESDLVVALAAYNAGPGQVERWQLPPNCDISRIPFPETRHYVRRVLRSQLRYSTLYPELDRTDH